MEQNKKDQNSLNQGKERSISIEETKQNINKSDKNEDNETHRKKTTMGNSKSAHLLQQVQNERKSADKEEITLENRIKRLEQEEKQLEKKIDEMQKKAKKIYEVKKNNQVKHVAQRVKQIEVEEIPFTQPKGQLLNLKVQLSKEEVQKQKKMQALEVKKKIIESTNEKAKNHFIQVEEQKWKASLMRQEQRQIKEKLNKLQEEKYMKIQKEKDEKRFREEKILQGKQQKIRELELREMQLLERIKQTQVKHTIADQELDFILNHKPKQYEEKYLKGDSNKYNQAQQNYSLNISEKGEANIH